MENNYGFKYFNEEIVNEVVAFYDSKSFDKEQANSLKAKVKEAYKALDASLKEENKARLAQAKNDHLTKIAELDNEYEANMGQKLEENKNADEKELKNIKVGLATVCKRAKIKENNSYVEQTRLIKMKRVDLHQEYVKLVYNITGKVSPIEAVRSKALENIAVFNLKRTLTNKKM